MRRLPGPFGNIDDGLEDLRREDITRLGGQHDEQVIVLGVGILQRLEGGELWVLVTEEDLIIGRELQETDAAARQRH